MLKFILDYSTNNYDRSGTSTPSIVNPQKQAPPKHPPMFITVSFTKPNRFILGFSDNRQKLTKNVKKMLNLLKTYGCCQKLTKT